MNRPKFVLLAVLLAAGSFAQPVQPVAARISAQNAIFEEVFENELREDPEFATSMGDYRYNDRLGDRSLAAIARRRDSDAAFLKRLESIATTGLPEQDQLSHELLTRILHQRLAEFDAKEHEMPVNQLGGVHIRLADLPLSSPLDSVKRYEDYIARLRQIPRALDQTVEVLKAGMRDNLMPVRFLLEKVPAQCDDIIKSRPFLLATNKYPASVPAADQKRLTARIADVTDREVNPAYARFAAFIRDEYAPRGRATLSITSLPGGDRRYADLIYARTTTRMSADEIHKLGLSEVERIQEQMTAIAKQQRFQDLAAYRASLAANPKYKPASEQQIVDDFSRYIALMEPKLPSLFGLLPKIPVTVEPMPVFQAASATHYVPGTPDGGRPGRVVVAVSNVAKRSLVNDEAVAYHEGVPGHHMQISIEQQLDGLPRFRKHPFILFNAYVEGWALYAEELGKEVGFYRDPASDYGRLSSELFRAVRLVVDTGIHAKGWAREQVVEYMRKSGAVDEPTIQSETDRYIARPAQALSYKIGQLKFRELRERARAKLGPKFDLRAFHDEMLNAGSLPLDLLDARADKWIARQAAAAGSGSDRAR